MREPSDFDRASAQAANDRGAKIKGREITAVQVNSWDERNALFGKRSPGRPIKGIVLSPSKPRVDTLVALAAGIDEQGSFDRAVIRAAAQCPEIGSKALARAYHEIYIKTGRFILNAQTSGKRLRFPTGVLSGRFNSLARSALYDLALGRTPITDEIDELIRALGLPDDLLTFPPDDVAKDYPGIVEIISCVSLARLEKDFRKPAVDREELAWMTDGLRAILCFAILLARYVILTNSPLPAVVDPDPKIDASGKHVLRTLIAGGRAIDILLKATGSSTDYMAALMAPALSIVLGILPEGARTNLQAIMHQTAQTLPTMYAMESLVDSTPPELRRFLAFDSSERLAVASDQVRMFVSETVLAWEEKHYEMAECLRRGNLEIQDSHSSDANN